MSCVFRFVLLFLLLASAFCVSAQEIASLTFKQSDDYRFDDEVLRAQVQTRPGKPYSERMVNDDVKRLYALGMFSDVVSETQTLPDGKKAVIFRITPKPVVSEILFEGNKKFSEKELSKLLKFSPDAPENDALIVETSDALRKFYVQNGHNDAQIQVRQDLDPKTGKVKIIFTITEHLRVRVNNVLFEGNTVYKPSDLKGLLETRYTLLSADWLSWLPLESAGLGLLSRDAIERDKIRLREHYWKKGFLDFTIKDVLVAECPNDPELADVTFIFDEGEPYFVGTVSIDGAARFPEEELRALIPMQTEHVYSSDDEDTALRRFRELYGPLGYADFNTVVEKIPNFKNHTVDLVFHVNEGTLYTIGEVYISGNKRTKDYVIRREILLTPDDPVDQNLMEISRNRLMGMGYFEEKASDPGKPGVEIIARNSPDDPTKKDIHIDVQEKQFLTGKIGAGWSDTDSLAGTIEIAHSNMDIFDPKSYFTGGGQRMRLSALFGLQHMNFEFDFTEPWMFGIPLRFDLSAYWREVLYDDWSERRIGFKVQLTKRIFDDFTSITGGYLFEQVRVYDMERKMAYRHFHDQTGSDLVGRVFFNLERDTRNSATNPTSGYSIGLYSSLSSVALGGSNNYYKLELKGVNYYSFFNDWFTLMTGFKFGSIGMFNNNEDVPLYDRYFLGGGDSVRGFPYRSIGPENIYNDNYGGQFMYLFTAELSHPIYKNYLRGAIFCDVGDVTSGSWGPINRPNVGIGYGLRIKLPQVDVPIRLDLAYPIVNQQDGVPSRLRFHFNMGFSFF